MILSYDKVMITNLWS